MSRLKGSMVKVDVCMKMQDTQMFPKVMKLLSYPNIWIRDTAC
jgi:hypothetical protein